MDAPRDAGSIFTRNGVQYLSYTAAHPVIQHSEQDNPLVVAMPGAFVFEFVIIAKILFSYRQTVTFCMTIETKLRKVHALGNEVVQTTARPESGEGIL